MPDRLLPFPLVAGHPILDLLNTVPNADGHPLELLRAPSDLVDWWRAAALPPIEHEVDAAALRAVRTLRDELRPGIDQLIEGGWGPPPLLRTIAAMLRRSPGHLELSVDGDRPRLRFRPHGDTAAAAMVALLGELAGQLVATVDPRLVKRCDDPACVLVFLDATRNRQRRWCSNKSCGNRAKVAAFRRRQREGVRAAERQRR